MSILIKGVEIPTDNTVLIRVFPVSENGECYVEQLDVDGDILDELWAVPVPTHGRLIDADALMKLDQMVGKLMMYGGEYVYTQSEIDRAPTIIPASEEGE